MILTAAEIEREMNEGNIRITPFVKENLQPNSYDLTLASTIYRIDQKMLDVKKPITQYTEFDIYEDESFLLKQGYCYLATHNENVFSRNHIGLLHGRSTLARYFLSIHQCAGFGDIGFEGHWTLEMVPMRDLVVYGGMRIAQIAFHTFIGDVKKKYSGRYIESSPVPRLPIPGNL